MFSFSLVACISVRASQNDRRKNSRFDYLRTSGYKKSQKKNVRH